jgi:hypothetical protein
MKALLDKHFLKQNNGNDEEEFPLAAGFVGCLIILVSILVFRLFVFQVLFGGHRPIPVILQASRR